MQLQSREKEIPHSQEILLDHTKGFYLLFAFHSLCHTTALHNKAGRSS